MADTAALVVALSAQLTKFERDMKKASEIADREVKKIENRFAKSNVGFDALAGQITRLATVGGIAALVQQVASLNKQVADIGEGAERVGLTTDEFQKMRFAVVATGGTLEAADAALDRFARVMSEAAQGSNDMAKFLRLNNVAITDQTGKLLPMNQLLARYADLVKNAKTPADQLRLTIEAVGRIAGPQMVEVFREGAEGIAKYGREADALGVVLDKAFIERAKKASDSFNVLLLRISTFFKEVAVVAAQALAEGGKSTQQQQEETAKFWSDTWKSYWDRFVKYIEQTNPEVGRIIGNAIDVATNRVITEHGNAVRKGAEILSKMTGPGLLGRTDERLSLAPTTTAGDKTTNTLTAQADAYQRLLDSQEKRIQLLNAEAESIGKTTYEATLLKTQIELENDAKSRGVQLTDKVIAQLREQAMRTAEAAQRIETLRENWRGMNEAVQFAGNQMIDIMTGLTQKTLTASEAMRQLTQTLVKALLQAALLGQGPLGNILGFGATTAGGTGGLLGALIPRQHGGPVSANRPYVVGEKGPELFVPRGSGKIVPSAISGRSSGGLMVEVNNFVAADTETRQRQTNQGGPGAERVVIDIIKKASARGEFDDVNRGRFGLRPQKVR